MERASFSTTIFSKRFIFVYCQTFKLQRPLHPTKLARHFTLLKSRVSGCDWQKHCRHYMEVRRNSQGASYVSVNPRGVHFFVPKSLTCYAVLCVVSQDTNGRKHLFFHFRPVPSSNSISFVWFKPREPIRKVRQTEFMVTEEKKSHSTSRNTTC